MIRCRLLLCAQGVVIDTESNSVSIFNILEEFQVGGFPFFFQQLFVFALFERQAEDPPEYDVMFRLSIGETELLASTLRIDFEDKLRNRSKLHIRGLVIPQPGTLSVVARVGENIVGTYDLIVQRIAPPDVETSQEPTGRVERVSPGGAKPE